MKIQNITFALCMAATASAIQLEIASKLESSIELESTTQQLVNPILDQDYYNSVISSIVKASDGTPDTICSEFQKLKADHPDLVLGALVGAI